MGGNRKDTRRPPATFHLYVEDATPRSQGSKPELSGYAVAKRSGAPLGMVMIIWSSVGFELTKRPHARRGCARSQEFFSQTGGAA